MRLRSAVPLSVALTVLGLSACGEAPSPNPTGPSLSVTGAATYAVQALEVPQPTILFEGEARGINDLGYIAGWVRSGDKYRALRWDLNNHMHDLGDLPGLPSDIANDINQSGTMIGFSFGSSVSFARPWVRTEATGMQALPDFGGNAGIPWGINSSGTIVGWAADTFGVVHAAKWDAAGNLTDLNPPGGTSQALDINDAGDIAGWTFVFGAFSAHAHLWRHDGAELDLGTLGGASSQAFGLNSSVTVVGVADPPFPDLPVAFSWTLAGGMKNLRYGPSSQAFAISDLGRSVGMVNQTGLTKLNGVIQILPDLAPLKGHFSGPVNVNRCGTIVGSSVSPEPTSAALMPVVWRNSACD